MAKLRIRKSTPPPYGDESDDNLVRGRDGVKVGVRRRVDQGRGALGDDVLPAEREDPHLPGGVLAAQEGGAPGNIVLAVQEGAVLAGKRGDGIDGVVPSVQEGGALGAGEPEFVRGLPVLDRPKPKAPNRDARSGRMERPIHRGGRRRPRSLGPGAAAEPFRPRPTGRNKNSQPAGDAPPEFKDLGRKVPCRVRDFNELDAHELMERGAAHARFSLFFFSKARAKQAVTGDGMAESSKSFSITTYYKGGLVCGFSMDPPSVPATPMSPAPNNHSPIQFFNEATNTEKGKNSEEAPHMESDELEQTHTRVDEYHNLNQGPESFTARFNWFNCREYGIVVRKTLTNYDVRARGIIVLPKTDAKANLPALRKSDRLNLKMDDFKLPATWDFKYRFWTYGNNERKYIMESTGKFVKSHSLKEGDTLIIYKSRLEPGKFLVRGEKATQQRAPLLCLECKEQVTSSEECMFAERA